VASASDTALAQDAPYGGYLGDTSNFDGTTVDMRGQSEVTIQVGASGNGGAFAFAPPAVAVDPGTTVTWEWTGEGGGHNVVDEAGNFESELVSDAGHTFEQTFEEAGVRQYFCLPHQGLGMKGVVAVGDTSEGTLESPPEDSGEQSTSGGQENDSAVTPLATMTLLGMLVLGFLSPIAFLLIARRRMGQQPPRPDSNP
jgi:halocyanin-like protein